MQDVALLNVNGETTLALLESIVCVARSVGNHGSIHHEIKPIFIPPTYL